MKILLLASGLGFLLGMRHAMDPDHVVAVSTIVAKSRRFGVSWLLGALWGLGHTLTIFVVGGAIILLKAQVPARLGLGLEFAVGLVLVVLGAANLAGRRTWPFSDGGHSHEHGHEGEHGHHPPFGPPKPEAHIHPHGHPRGLAWLERAALEAGGPQMLRAFAVGIVHGLAGSAAVALLVLASIPSAAGGLAYLLVFGAGTLAGMMVLSAAMEGAFLWVGRRLQFRPWVLSGTGLVSVLLGLYIMYQTGWVDGLFLPQALWEPR